MGYQIFPVHECGCCISGRNPWNRHRRCSRLLWRQGGQCDYAVYGRSLIAAIYALAIAIVAALGPGLVKC